MPSEAPQRSQRYANAGLKKSDQIFKPQGFAELLAPCTRTMTLPASENSPSEVRVSAVNRARDRGLESRRRIDARRAPLHGVADELPGLEFGFRNLILSNCH
jgi:hypothetical protein